MKRISWFLATVLVALALGLSACNMDATVVSQNLSKAADQFEINRRVVFYNGITDKYMLLIEGRCSLDFGHLRDTVTCKTGPTAYKKHYMGKADNLAVFAEQLKDIEVSAYHYRVVFKPQSIIPDMDARVSGGELLRDRH